MSAHLHWCALCSEQRLCSGYGCVSRRVKPCEDCVTDDLQFEEVVTSSRFSGRDSLAVAAAFSGVGRSDKHGYARTNTGGRG